MAYMRRTFDKDEDGSSKPDSFVGKKYFHPKTGHLYRVTGYSIDAQRELWVLHYERIYDTTPPASENVFTYIHTIADFTRVGRFLEVK